MGCSCGGLGTSPRGHPCCSRVAPACPPPWNQPRTRTRSLPPLWASERGTVGLRAGVDGHREWPRRAMGRGRPRPRAEPRGPQPHVTSVRPGVPRQLSAPVSGIAITNRRYDTFTNEIDLVKSSIQFLKCSPILPSRRLPWLGGQKP